MNARGNPLPWECRWITYANLLVLGTSCEVLSIGTEADTADVKVTILVDVLILQSCHILSCGHIKDLRRPVAARRQILAITAEPNTANDTVVAKMVHQLDIQHTLNLRIEHCIPVCAFALLGRRQVLRVPVGQHVAWTIRATRGGRLSTWRGRTNLRRGTGVRVGELSRLRGGWAGGCTAGGFTGTRRGGGGRWGAAIAYWHQKK